MQNSQFAEEASGTMAGCILLLAHILTSGIMEDIIMAVITDAIMVIINCKNMGRSPALVSLFIMKQFLEQGFRTHQLLTPF
jgi:hypothetical protein